MIDRLISLIAPHLCYGCGKSGALLCDNCKYNIVSESYSSCIRCGSMLGEKNACRICQLPYSRVWCVGERSGILQRLIGDFKFQRTYAAHRELAGLLLARIDQLPANTIIVPVPTVASHIRERGYDHMQLITKKMAKARHLQTSSVLQRKTNTKQRQATRSQREAQAKAAFYVLKPLSSVPYLLVDDVTTTGATLYYAAKALKDAGAGEVWVAVIARQPLD